MAKINFNPEEFEDEEIIELSPSASGSTALIPSEVLPPSAPLERSQKSSNALESLMGGLTPTGAAVCIARSALDIIPEIGRCIATVSMEKQRTKQIQTLASIEIEKSKQQTKRVQIEQREETKRYKMQQETELAQQQIELKKYIAEVQLKGMELANNHQEYMASLDDLREIISSFILRLNRINQEISMDMDTEKLQVVFKRITDAESKLVDLSKQIVELRRR